MFGSPFLLPLSTPDGIVGQFVFPRASATRSRVIIVVVIVIVVVVCAPHENDFDKTLKDHEPHSFLAKITKIQPVKRHRRDLARGNYEGP